MGRLARKEGTIKIILITVAILLLVVACSPIVSTTSLIHSIAKGDAFGTATGIFGKFANTEEVRKMFNEYVSALSNNKEREIVQEEISEEELNDIPCSTTKH